MKAYVINLRHAKERREFIQKQLSICFLEYEIIDAIYGREIALPTELYSSLKYVLAHGKKTNPSEIGCYLSHMKALKYFLGSSHEFALILEDDVLIPQNIKQLLDHCIMFSSSFDLLRLSGVHSGTPIKIHKLDDKYTICCNLTRLTGSGAYLINKRGAQELVSKLLPMWLPYDHALDRDWKLSITALTLNPLPIKQNIIFKTQIEATQDYKLPWFIRYWTVFPFRFFNEISRVYYRTCVILKKRLTLKNNTKRILRKTL